MVGGRGSGGGEIVDARGGVLEAMSFKQIPGPARGKGFFQPYKVPKTIPQSPAALGSPLGLGVHQPEGKATGRTCENPPGFSFLQVERNLDLVWLPPKTGLP